MRLGRWGLIALASAGLAATDAAGQAGDAGAERDSTQGARRHEVAELRGARADVRYSAAFVPPSHWSHAAARRLDALGLVPPGFDGSRSAHTQREVALLLAHALDSIAADSSFRSRTRSVLQEQVAGYVMRFRGEFAQTASRDGWLGVDRGRGSRAAIGYRRAAGRLATGWGYQYGDPHGVEWHAPEPLPDLEGPTVEAGLQVNLAEAVAVRAEPQWTPSTIRARELYASAGFGALALWAGRRATGYPVGTSGGVVLTGTALDGLGIQTRRPLNLPSFLSVLGPASLELVLAQRDMPHSFENNLFLVTRGAIEPHRRLRLGVTRAVEFGGEGNTELDWFAMFSVLVGKHAGEGSEFDNQVASIDASYRPPTESWLPMRTYLEWGFEDSAGAWKDTPGIVAGVELPSVPGLPGVAVAVERVSFSGPCCGNPIWYRHLRFHDGWTGDGRPLGHPIGGEGTEWHVRAEATFAAGRLRPEVRLFRRDRGMENLYEPQREGVSKGLHAGAEWTLDDRAEILVRFSLERGEDWQESAVYLGIAAWP